MIHNPIRCDYLRLGANTNPALDLAATKNYLKIDPGQTADDELITELIATAAIIFESFTGLNLLTQDYEASCTGFPFFIKRQITIGVTEFTCIQLRKAPLFIFDTICFLENDIFVEWSNTEYEVIPGTRSTYPAIFAKTEWPRTDQHPRPVKITFTAGFGATFDSIPIPIRTGLLQHIAFMYENRGDCACDKGGAGSGFGMKSLPVTSRLAYSPYVIYSITNEWGC